MKLIRNIGFWIVLIPLILRYGFGKWYVFNGSPDWLVNMAADRWKPDSDSSFIQLWAEAVKERTRRKLPDRSKEPEARSSSMQGEHWHD